MKIRDLLSSKVTRNASWIIAGRVYHMLLAFLVGLLTARYLGPSNFGLINYAATYTSFFASFCTLGINSVIVKRILWIIPMRKAKPLDRRLSLERFPASYQYL